MKWEGGYLFYFSSTSLSILIWLLHSQGIIEYLRFLLISFRGDSSRESGHPQASFLFKWRDSLFHYRLSQKFGLRISAWDLLGACFFKMSPPYTYSTCVSKDEACVSTILISPSDSSSQKNVSFKMTTCDLGEWQWNMYNIIYEMNRQSRFDVWYRMLGAGALGWPRGMVLGRRWEGGSGWGTHVYPWQIHVDVWQQYNIVK